MRSCRDLTSFWPPATWSTRADPRSTGAFARSSPSSSCRYTLFPVNHDPQQPFREAFADHAYLGSGPSGDGYVIDDYAVRLIGLDTTAPDSVGGALDNQRLAWRDERLKEAPDRPTLLFMHHPPFRTGIRPLDAPGFVGMEGLAAIVERHSQILRIACGHIHRAMQVRWHNTIACTAPSTAVQFALDLRERVQLGFVLEPPGFLLHVWNDGLMVTHECRVGRFDSGRLP